MFRAFIFHSEKFFFYICQFSTIFRTNIGSLSKVSNCSMNVLNKDFIRVCESSLVLLSIF